MRTDEIAAAVAPSLGMTAGTLCMVYNGYVRAMAETMGGAQLRKGLTPEEFADAAPDVVLEYIGTFRYPTIRFLAQNNPDSRTARDNRKAACRMIRKRQAGRYAKDNEDKAAVQQDTGDGGQVHGGPGEVLRDH